MTRHLTRLDPYEMPSELPGNACMSETSNSLLQTELLIALLPPVTPSRYTVFTLVAMLPVMCTDLSFRLVLFSSSHNKGTLFTPSIECSMLLTSSRKPHGSLRTGSLGHALPVSCVANCAPRSRPCCLCMRRSRLPGQRQVQHRRWSASMSVKCTCFETLFVCMLPISGIALMSQCTQALL
jgi:hypothetical protein